MRKYDIFISYRREGGYDTAKHLHDLLVRDGYNVSFDIDTLRNGDFDTQLLTRIEECKDFILIVDEHAFDRTLDPTFDPQKDWLRCELAHAIKHRKNIVPIFLSNVSTFPEGLPEDIAAVSKKNGPQYNRYYFDHFYKKLRSEFLKSRSKRKGIIAFSITVAILLSMLIAILGENTPSTTGDQGTEEEKEIKYVDPMLPHSTNEAEFYEYAQSLLDEILNSGSKKDKSSDLFFGLCHLLGHECQADLNEAIKYLSNAANNDIAVAQHLMGVCYDNGIGVEQDINRAIELYHKASEEGIIEAQCDYGISCTSQNRIHEAEVNILEAANNGCARAQYTLGWHYSYNNRSEAIYWINKSAEQGYDMAKIAIANIYRANTQNYEEQSKAVEIYKELATEDNFLALYGLAICYYQGFGIEQDIDTAMILINKSAELGYAQALTDLGTLYCGGGINISQDYDKAIELFTKAAEQGFPIAQVYLGKMYENGWGVEQDMNKAKKLYDKAERQGFNLQMLQLQQQYQRQLQQQQD